MRKIFQILSLVWITSCATTANPPASCDIEIRKVTSKAFKEGYEYYGSKQVNPTVMMEFLINKFNLWTLVHLINPPKEGLDYMKNSKEYKKLFTCVLSTGELQHTYNSITPLIKKAH